MIITKQNAVIRHSIQFPWHIRHAVNCLLQRLDLNDVLRYINFVFFWWKRSFRSRSSKCTNISPISSCAHMKSTFIENYKNLRIVFVSPDNPISRKSARRLSRERDYIRPFSAPFTVFCIGKLDGFDRSIRKVCSGTLVSSCER